MPEIPQVSMSDVAFLLLIFFLSAAIFDVERGIPLVLPGVAATPTMVSKREVVSIRSDAEGRLSLDGVSFPLDQIGLVVAERMRAHPDLVVAIETHPKAPYRTMVAVLDEVRKAQVARISLKMGKG